LGQQETQEQEDPTMWKLFGSPKGPKEEPVTQRDALDVAMRALADSEVDRPLPTLVCRACGLKYFNTGTYLQGSRCPDCHPNG
jgi:predicted Zn-ribbon and HTH transcriptional regulator